MPAIMKFENGRGHISVEPKYIIAFFSDNENRSFKVPRTVTPEPNIKKLHDVLQMANLAGYMLTEESLEKFDEIVEEWKNAEDA